MSVWSNFHCHSNFSDGQGTPEDIVKKAIELKMPSIGISEHCPVPFKTAWNLKADKVDSYLRLINTLKKKYEGKIEVYCGMEIDYISDMQDDIIKKSKINKLDFVIGSIHFLGFLGTGQPWNIDGTGELFKKGMKEIFKNDGIRLVESYYEYVATMVTQLKPNIIGHIDKIRLHNVNDIYFSEHSGHYKKAAMNALEVVKKADCFVEINTRGLYKHLNKEPYPSAWMLKQMKQLGLRTVLSSDSHVPDDLLREFSTAVEFLKEAGYRSRFTLEKNKWKEVALD
jgi:histidinol phosphate phosphatase HisJ family